jgi:LmbE family N-acetylglucosaminyl deacetylase
LGVSLSRQVYLGLPDGAITANNIFQSSLNQVAVDFVPDRVFTLGRRGYDLHPDHVSSHEAALGAVSLLRESGRDVGIWALDEYHQGELLDGDYWNKIGAMAMHVSQTVSTDFDHWGGTDFYTPLIVKGEHFEQL